ncbi:MAG: LysR family transcriptional regulator [Pseudomonadota bacterium]
MNLTNLKTFLAIVESGNLNRAAAQLNVTQSTVHARLNQLEQSLGQPLILRKKSGAEKTPAGYRFERYAQLMMDMWRQAQQETGLPSDVVGVGNFGCHVDLWPHRGRAFFEDWRRHHPQTALSAWPGEQVTLDRWMRSGMVDVAMSYTAALDDAWNVEQLRSESLIQVATTARARVRWDPAYIYVDLGESFRRDHAAEYGDSETPMVTFGSPQWALEHLLREGGSAYIPEPLAIPHIDSGKLFRVTGSATFSRPVYRLTNRDFDRRWNGVLSLG